MQVSELLKLIDYSHIQGNTDIPISGIKSFEPRNLERNALMWVNSKNAPRLDNQTKGILICPVDVIGAFSKDLTLIFSNYPRRTFKEVLNILYGNKKKKFAIAPSAFIAKTAQCHSDIIIGHNVVIEDNCILEKGVEIRHNTVIRANTIIRQDVKIGSNCTIGAVGFGYEKNENGDYEQILHIGNVEIESGVEIGNNTCIDRAVLGSTKIGRNVKIDNLVHISHGVEIAENALIIANAMIAGSVKIGKNTWVAPSSSILNKVVVGDDVTIGLGAVVIRPVENNDIVVGNPAKSLKRK